MRAPGRKPAAARGARDARHVQCRPRTRPTGAGKAMHLCVGLHVLSAWARQRGPGAAGRVLWPCPAAGVPAVTPHRLLLGGGGANIGHVLQGTAASKRRHGGEQAWACCMHRPPPPPPARCKGAGAPGGGCAARAQGPPRVVQGAAASLPRPPEPPIPTAATLTCSGQSHQAPAWLPGSVVA
jgi:hypothetical protein